MNRSQILDAAKEIITGDRHQQYGEAENNFARIAALWEVYLRDKVIPFGNGITLDAADVGIMMTLFKIGRIMGGNYKADSFVDACGYLACAGEIEAMENEDLLQEL